MDKSITTAFLIIISIVMSVLLFNAAYPAVRESSDAIANMAGRADDRLRSQIKIIHAVGELDSTGWWQDINADGDFDAFVWVKNIGSVRIVGIDRLDVFFGPEGNFMRIPHQSEAGGLYPYWTWEIENGSDWAPTATLKITIHHAFPLPTGRYFVKVTIPNGVADDYFLGM